MAPPSQDVACRNRAARKAWATRRARAAGLQPTPAPAPEPDPTGPVYLVGCGKAKRAEASEAREIYTSVRFRLARRLAERGRAWFVLSARHALVDPAERIVPYDEELPSGKRGAPGREVWARRVVAALALRFSVTEPLEFVVLAGPKYAGALAGVLPAAWQLSTPLAGKGTGAANHWLSRQVRGGARA